jgi:Tfp pilus assembly protein PilN
MSSHRPSLRSIVFFGAAALMLIPAIVAGTLYTGALQRRTEELLTEKLTARGELGAQLLARRLHQLWQEVDLLSKSIDPGALQQARAEIDFITKLDRRYSWLGVTDLEGKVLVASNGLLEGASVAQRPWFRRGLGGPVAIDVHEAQLLAKLLPAQSEPYRFIDLAAPLQRQGQRVAGVIGAHLDWRWVVENMKALQAPGIDVLLLSRERTVLFGPPEFVDKPLAIGSAQAANRVTSAVLDERWPDGKDYITVVIPAVGHADLPSFGWSLLIRQDVQQALGPTRELVRDFWSMLGAGALAALLLLFLGATWITTPLKRLTRSAEELLTDAEAKPPYAESRYDEVSRLSSALVKLQSRLRR